MQTDLKACSKEKAKRRGPAPPLSDVGCPPFRVFIPAELLDRKIRELEGKGVFAAESLLTHSGGRRLLGAGDSVEASKSILWSINQAIVEMMNTNTKDVLPTAIYTNAQVQFLIELEILKVGSQLTYAPI